jgi:hypothetical protein
MIPNPPASSGTDLFRFLQGVASALNRLPEVSNFSLPTPNSFVTATRGTFGFNTNSTASVLWVKQVGSGNTGWTPLI